MSDSITEWPQGYNPGPAAHLHALGVIAMNIGSFEDNIDSFYFEVTGLVALPLAAMIYNYYRQDEGKRLQQIRKHFKIHNFDSNICKSVDNMLEYFQWCKNCRNQLLHGSLYPAGLFGKADRLYMMKRISKTSEEIGYLNLTLEEIRNIADKIRIGVIHSINLRFYVKYHGLPVDRVPVQRRPYVPQSLPKRLQIPRTLELTPHP